MAKNPKNTNGIYSSGKLNSSYSQFVKFNRVQFLDRDIGTDLNTYANFGIFPTFADTYPDMWDVVNKEVAVPLTDKNGKPIVDKTTGKVKTTKVKKDVVDWNNGHLDAEGGATNYDQGLGTPGVRSLFNKAGAVIIGVNNMDSTKDYGRIDINKFSSNNTNFDGAMNQWRLSRNVPLLDSPEIRRDLRRNLSCTIRDLVYDSRNGKMGLETYDFSDFMYCKHLGKMPNNYLITLRKFPYPVGDYIGGDLYRIKHTGTYKAIINSLPATSVGCMVTWMGVSGNHLNEILRYSYKQPFKEQQAELQDSKSDADSNTSLLSGIFSAFDSSYQKAYAEGRAGTAANAAFGHFGINLGDPPYKDHNTFKDRNKVYGPIDAIKTTYIRSDEGMIFNHKFTLTFEYELRAYNGINPRQAMLDLLSNILTVTYTTGSFWGGGIKAYGAQQSNIFANLNIFKKGNRTFTDFADSFSKDLTSLSKRVSDNLGFNKNNFSFTQLWKNLTGVLNTLGGMLVGGMLNRLGRPQKAMYNSLLSPAPIGFWHVTIGNPKAPIMSIGNLILTNVQIEHNGPLGLDNFPTGLKVTVDLDRGKPRDSRDIEKLYMHGNDRIYSSMSDKVFNMYKHANIYKINTQNKSWNSIDSTAFTDKTKDPFTVNTDPNNDYTSTPIERPYKNGKKEQIEQTTYTYSTYDFNADNIKAYSDTDTSPEAKVYNKLLKYAYGRGDAADIKSIYISATEQEYGSGKHKKQKTASVQQYTKDGKKIGKAQHKDVEKMYVEAKI